MAAGAMRALAAMAVVLSSSVAHARSSPQLRRLLERASFDDLAMKVYYHWNLAAGVNVPSHGPIAVDVVSAGPNCRRNHSAIFAKKQLQISLVPHREP